MKLWYGFGLATILSTTNFSRNNNAHRSDRPPMRFVNPGEDECFREPSRLDERLSDLLERLITKRYRAQKVRKRHIPKGQGKTRPLGIPALEDKIVQMAAAKLLSAIYESDFLDSSVGYRPKKGAREATQKLQHEIYHRKVAWIVEADIKSFFDCADHEWLLKMLGQRVDDKAFVGLVRKWLKAGVMEEGSARGPSGNGRFYLDGRKGIASLIAAGIL